MVMAFKKKKRFQLTANQKNLDQSGGHGGMKAGDSDQQGMENQQRRCAPQVPNSLGSVTLSGDLHGSSGHLQLCPGNMQLALTVCP